MNWTTIALLLRADLAAHRGRTLAAIVAISVGASVLLVAFVGVHTLQKNAPRYADFRFPEDELHLIATDTIFPVLDEKLLTAIRADARVAGVETCVSAGMIIMPGKETGELDAERFFSTDEDGLSGWIPGDRFQAGAWSGADHFATLKEGRWPAADTVDPIEVAIDEEWLYGAKLGSWLRLESDTGVHRARLVGIISSGGSFIWTAYTTRSLAVQTSTAAVEKLAGVQPPPSSARVRLHRAGDRRGFLAEWRPRLTAVPGRLEMWDRADFLHAALHGEEMAWLRSTLLTIVVVAGSCVVALTLAVQGAAVSERMAHFTLLRAIGAERRMLFLAVAASVVPVAAGGLLGAIALAWSASVVLTKMVPFSPVDGQPPDVGSILFTGAIILLAALLGSLWPAWKASRARPFDDANRIADPARWSRRCLAIAALVAVATVAICLLTVAPEVHGKLLAWVGLPGLALTALLATPALVRLVGRLFTNLIARLTGSDPLVLADQVAGDGPRSAGSVATLAIGLGSFVALLTWGNSVLDQFVIDPAMPRWMFSVHPHGLDRAETERLLSEAPMTRKHALTFVDTRLGQRKKPWGSGPWRPGTDFVPALVMGIDPVRVFADRADALPVRFVEGERSAALKALAGGGDCLISDWFSHAYGVRVGDVLPVAAPGRGDRTYRVAGVIDFRGWRMMTKRNKVRLHGDWHEALVVLDAGVVRRDFPAAYANYLIGDSLPDASGRVSTFRRDVPEEQAYAPAHAERIALEAAVTKLVNLARPVEHHPEGIAATVTATQRVMQADDIDRWRVVLWGSWGGAAVKQLGFVPLMVLTLALLSVAGTLVAALRARSRELGVLRSCGLTRSGVLRLALGESLLIGFAAIVLGTLAGGIGALVLLEVTSLLGYGIYDGLAPDFLMPWAALWPGWLIALAVCTAAALWAGWRMARRAPAELLAGDLHLS